MPLIAAGVFGLAALLAQSPLLLGIARWGGVAFLLWYAFPGTAPRLQQRCRCCRCRAARRAGAAEHPGGDPAQSARVPGYGAADRLAGQPAGGAGYAAGAGASLLWFLSSLALGAAWLAPWLARPSTWRVLDILVALMKCSALPLNLSSASRGWPQKAWAATGFPTQLLRGYAAPGGAMIPLRGAPSPAPQRRPARTGRCLPRQPSPEE